ncbi:MAG: hypothetical protein IPN59_04125 [Holophaga sp.]|nr:hypothetical protein [Holophaga sp.]
MRISRNFRIAKHFSLEGIIDVYNVFNWANQWISSSNRSFSTGPTSAKFVNFAQVDMPDQKTREVQFTLKARF